MDTIEQQQGDILDKELSRAGVEMNAAQRQLTLKYGADIAAFWMTMVGQLEADNKKKISDLKVKSETNKETISEYVKQLAQVRSILVETRRNHQELQTKHEELQTEYEELQTKHEELQTEYEELQTDCDVWQNVVSELQLNPCSSQNKCPNGNYCAPTLADCKAIGGGNSALETSGGSHPDATATLTLSPKSDETSSPTGAAYSRRDLGKTTQLEKTEEEPAVQSTTPESSSSRSPVVAPGRSPPAKSLPTKKGASTNLAARANTTTDRKSRKMRRKKSRSKKKSSRRKRRRTMKSKKY